MRTVLRRMFGAKWEEVTGDWRRLHNKELHNLYASRDVIRVIKSRNMRGRACRTRGRDEKGILNFSGKTRREETIRKTLA
jgi:hypothetical protein